MARYIKAVECAEIISEKLNIPLGDLVDIFAEIPTADVVPKSEVERLEKDNEDLRNVLTNTINKYRNCEAEVAKEIFEEIEREIKNHGIAYAQRKIAELKKKYTEGEQRND